MKIGFTGSRHGMSEAQKRQLGQVLLWLLAAERLLEAGSMEGFEFHHGAGTGDNGKPSADEEAAEIAKRLIGERGVVPHPPASYRADDLLARDDEIVAAVQVLIAAPLNDKEEIRSGTWYTVRRARDAKMPVIQLSRGAERNGRRRHR